jgi:redox-sensing transcriptional repressor
MIIGRIEREHKGQREIPEPTLRRLPQYCHYLTTLIRDGVGTVSCSQIGAELALPPIQVRKDLQIAGIGGRPKVGYSVPALVNALETYLGWNNAKEAFLIGAGKLGTALLGYPRFSKFGLNIVAAFDVDPAKIGQSIRDCLVLPLDKLPDLARRMSIHIGILTVPAAAAQATANLLVNSGIVAIWNFAPLTLKVPKNIIVHNEDLYSSLATLSVKLTKALRASSSASGEPRAYDISGDQQAVKIRESVTEDSAEPLGKMPNPFA